MWYYIYVIGKDMWYDASQIYIRFVEGKFKESRFMHFHNQKYKKAKEKARIIKDLYIIISDQSNGYSVHIQKLKIYFENK